MININEIYQHRIQREALDKLRSTVREAIRQYDMSGDHSHQGSPMPGDCIRCGLALVVGLPVVSGSIGWIKRNQKG